MRQGKYHPPHPLAPIQVLISAVMSEILSECLASAHPQLPRIPLHWSIFHLRRMMYMMITSRKVNQVNTIHQVWSHPWSLLLIFSEFFETQKTQSYQCLTRLECSSLSRYYRQQRSEMRSLTCDCVRLLICHRFALSGHFHLPATCALQPGGTNVAKLYI